VTSPLKPRTRTDKPVGLRISLTFRLIRAYGAAVTGVASDAGSDTLEYRWHVVASNGQEIADGFGLNFEFIPADDGVYTVTFTASDDDTSSTATVIVTTNNASPTVSITGAPSSIVEGSPISLGSSASDPGSDSFT
jgi:hypothetical protein